MKTWLTPILVLLCSQFLCLSPTAAQSADAGLGELRQLRFDPIPLARVGDDPEEPLYDVRGIVVLPGGGFVIGEGSTNTLRFYDSDGRLTKVVGRAGEGPGEFRRLYWVRRYGDRLYAFDSSQRRLSEYTLGGSLVGTVTVLPVPPFAAVLPAGVFSDGTFLARGILGPSSPSHPGIMREEIALLRFDRDGSFIDQIGRFEGTEAYVEPRGTTGRLISYPAFARASEVVVDGSNIVTVENNTPHIHVRSPDGSTLLSLEPVRGLEPRAVLDRDVKLMRARFLADETPGNTSRADLFDRMPVPDTYPFFGWASWDRRPLLTARDSEIWVLKYGGLSELGPTWMIFDLESARQTGELSSADDVELWDVAGDLAGVLYRTELDEEIVELRRFRSS
jgi:hypothetical protein